MIGLPLGNSKHELGTKNIGHITPLPSHNDHVSTTATFFCLQGGLWVEAQLQGFLNLYSLLQSKFKRRMSQS